MPYAIDMRSPDVIDLLTELVNIGVGRAAAALSELVECRVELTVPTIRVIGISQSDRLVHGGQTGVETMVVQDFTGTLSGRSVLIFDAPSGQTLASLLSGQQSADGELDVEQSGVLLEVGNILLNSLMGTLANEAGYPLTYSLPTLYSSQQSLTRLYTGSPTSEPDLLVADVQFSVDDRAIRGSLVTVLSGGSIRQIVEAIQPVTLPEDGGSESASELWDGPYSRS